MTAHMLLVALFVVSCIVLLRSRFPVRDDNHAAACDRAGLRELKWHSAQLMQGDKDRSARSRIPEVRMEVLYPSRLFEGPAERDKKRDLGPLRHR